MFEKANFLEREDLATQILGMESAGAVKTMISQHWSSLALGRQFWLRLHRRTAIGE
jgi:hypothetical protein